MICVEFSRGGFQYLVGNNGGRVMFVANESRPEGVVDGWPNVEIKFDFC